MRRTSLTAQAIDEALAESFPASDPPAWTPGMARPRPAPAPEVPGESPDRDSVADDANAAAPLRLHAIE